MNLTPMIHAARLLFLLLPAAGVQALPLRPGTSDFPVVDAIPIKEGTLLEKDCRAEEHAWAERFLLAPARKRWEGKAWAEDAAALMQVALEHQEKEHRSLHPLAPLAGRFRELLKKATDDPLLMVFAAKALYGEREDWRESRPLLESVLAQGAVNGALEMMAVGTRWEVAKNEGLNTDALQEHWLRALARTFSDDSYDEATHTVLLRHHMQALGSVSLNSPDPLASYARHVQEARLPDWLKLTLRGMVEKNLAWVKRSSSWAQDVNDTQWQGFAEHLKSARDLLGQASRLRPDRPEAPGAMIAVAMGENVAPSELRAWFDRSVSAQFDYAPAYTSLLWAYRPRWGGSHDLMLAFGKACAATQRFDTFVPSRLMVAASNVVEEVFEPIPVFRHPEVMQAMADMSRGYLEHSPTEPPLTRHLLQSNAAMCAWLADDDALARKALDAAGPRLYPSTRAFLNEMLLHESFLRAEVAADTGIYGEAIRVAANPAPKTPLKDIHAAFMKIDDKDLSEDALAYLKEARELTGLTEAVEAGGWVDIHFHKHLTAFFQSEKGEWTVDPDGSLVCHGTDHPRSKFILRVPMGPNVEMRGEVAFEIPQTLQKSQFGSAIGPMLHWLPSCTSGVRVLLNHLSDDRACTNAYCDSMQNSTSDIHFSLQEWNTFSVRAADGKFSYDVNDRPMATKFELARLGLETESGMLGFSAYRMPIGSKARIRNVSIRKITAADLVAKVAASKPAAVVATAPSTESLLDWIWKPAIIGVLILAAIYGPRLIRSEENE